MDRRLTGTKICGNGTTLTPLTVISEEFSQVRYYLEITYIALKTRDAAATPHINDLLSVINYKRYV